eukprot:scaffold170877_cov33-Tisochrysis_lutea.AAC.2
MKSVTNLVLQALLPLVQVRTRNHQNSLKSSEFKGWGYIGFRRMEAWLLAQLRSLRRREFAFGARGIDTSPGHWRPSCEWSTFAMWYIGARSIRMSRTSSRRPVQRVCAVRHHEVQAVMCNYGSQLCAAERHRDGATAHKYNGFEAASKERIHLSHVPSLEQCVVARELWLRLARRRA